MLLCLRAWGIPAGDTSTQVGLTFAGLPLKVHLPDGGLLMRGEYRTGAGPRTHVAPPPPMGLAHKAQQLRCEVEGADRVPTGVGSLQRIASIEV